LAPERKRRNRRDGAAARKKGKSEEKEREGQRTDLGAGGHRQERNAWRSSGPNKWKSPCNSIAMERQYRTLNEEKEYQAVRHHTKN